MTLQRLKQTMAPLILILVLVGMSSCRGTTSSNASAYDQALPRLIEFVEQTRNQHFRARPAVRVLDPHQFVAEVKRLRTLGPPLPNASRVYRLMGLPDIGHVSAPPDAMVFPGTNEILMADRPFTKEREMVLVHELTHVLDDQLFPRKPEVSALSEWQFVGTSVREGSAQLVEREYLDSMKPADRDLFVNRIGKFETGEIATPAERIRASSYILGLRYMDARLSDGGWTSVEQALSDPPRSSSELLHPPHGGAVVEHGASGGLGEYLLGEMLSPIVGTTAARRDAASWVSDSLAVDTTCVTVKLRWMVDSQLLRDLRTWAEKKSSRKVVAVGDLIEIESCGP